MVSIDPLVNKVMNFAQKLVEADRASLFLVDNKNKELFARVFDVGSENNEYATSVSETDHNQKLTNEIRLPLGSGIAGHVALTGEVLNINNAYEDCRFNR